MAGIPLPREGRLGALPTILWKTVKLLATVAVTFLGLLLVTFLISHVVAVDPVLAVVGDRASKATYDKMFLEMGLDKPLWEQFWIYLQKVLSGNFGNSFLTKKPVLGDLARAQRLAANMQAASVIAASATPIGTLVQVATWPHSAAPPARDPTPTRTRPRRVPCCAATGSRSA